MNIVRDDNNDMTNSQSVLAIVGILFMTGLTIFTVHILSKARK
jgi:hypothetical protein